jgi:hypothetical protein
MGQCYGCGSPMAIGGAKETNVALVGGDGGGYGRGVVRRSRCGTRRPVAAWVRGDGPAVHFGVRMKGDGDDNSGNDNGG